ncbi:MAG: T9SS type A sorting domain-containing protein [Bacteroidia bacterium]|nr:T9SS type A sorting domain-containing protein [Bacteroidia bacterium]
MTKINILLFSICLFWGSLPAFAQSVLPHIWRNNVNLSVHTFAPRIQMTPQGNLLVKVLRVDLDASNTMHGSALMMYNNSGTILWDTLFANASPGLIDFLRSAHTDSAGYTWAGKDNASPSHHELIRFDPQGNVVSNFLLTMTRLFHYENEIVENHGNLDFIEDITAQRLYYVVEPINFSGNCSNNITALMYIDQTTGLSWMPDSIHLNDCSDNVFCFIRDDNDDFYFLNSDENMTGVNNRVLVSKLIGQQITPVLTIDSLNHWLLPKCIRKTDRWLMCNFLADSNTTHNYAKDVIKIYDMSTASPQLIKTLYFDLKLTPFEVKDGYYYVGEKYELTQTPVTDHNKVHKIDPQGNIVWTYDFGLNNKLKVITVNDAFVYAVTEKNDSTTLYEIDRNSGLVTNIYSLYPDFPASGKGVFQAIIGETDNILYLSGSGWNMNNQVEAIIGKYKVNTVSTGVEPQLYPEKEWSISPNPASDYFQLTGKLPQSPFECVITDIRGSEVIRKQMFFPDRKVSTVSLPKGVYYVKIGSITQKLMIE